jgi:hypothetical protein
MASANRRSDDLDQPSNAGRCATRFLGARSAEGVHRRLFEQAFSSVIYLGMSGAHYRSLNGTGALTSRSPERDYTKVDS